MINLERPGFEPGTFSLKYQSDPTMPQWIKVSFVFQSFFVKPDFEVLAVPTKIVSAPPRTRMYNPPTEHNYCDSTRLFHNYFHNSVEVVIKVKQKGSGVRYKKKPGLKLQVGRFFRLGKKRQRQSIKRTSSREIRMILRMGRRPEKLKKYIKNTIGIMKILTIYIIN